MDFPETYLITGCSSGLGVCLARAALATGARVIATARDPARNREVYEDLQDLGVIWESLDVQSPQVGARIQEITTTHGCIDVLINNAGTGGAVRPLEECDLDVAHKVFDTNLWGSFRTTQAVLPSMRSQHSGCIVNVSSASVFDRLPGLGIYAASKAALDAMSASLAAEVAPLGIRVILVTPADMRTPFVGQHKIDDILPPLGDAYAGGSVKAVQDFLHGVDGKQSIDPAKAAARIVEAAEKNTSHLGSALIRLPIGLSAARSMRAWTQDLLEQVDRTEGVWSSVEHAAQSPGGHE